MPGPRAVPVRMTIKRERKLRQIISAGTSPQRLVLRARIILAAAASCPNAKISRDLGCSEKTVREWRGRFAVHGIPGIFDKPRPGRPEIHGPSEAQSVSSLNNPSIVAVYDTGEDLSTGVPVPYIVMESVDGRTVRDLLIEGHRLPPERSLEIINGVLRALEYSHQAGIVHRDIKPANVMISRNGEVKVMDFGIARNKGDDTMTQTAQVIGTAQYLSPEQARGERVDSRSDLYSTGCLMYELLTGRPPFTGDSPVAIAYQHVRENPIPPSQLDPDIPPWADAIVLKAMAKSPDERYQTAAEMRPDVERAASGEEVTATLPPRTRAESHGHTNHTRRMGPQTMTGTAPTAATPPLPLPGYDDYHEFWQPQGTKAQRWPGWFGRKPNEI